MALLSSCIGSTRSMLDVVQKVVKARFFVLFLLRIRILHHLKLGRFDFALDVMEKGFFLIVDQLLYRSKFGIILKKFLRGKTDRSHRISNLIILLIAIFYLKLIYLLINFRMIFQG